VLGASRDPAEASSHAAFTRLVDILAPYERDAVAFMEAYFDESLTSDGPRVMAVGGYLFTAERSKALAFAWREVLNQYGLPFFHMVDCAHGAPPFKDLGKEACDDVARHMIRLIREHMEYGVAYAVDDAAYSELFPTNSLLESLSGTSYAHCCWACLASIGAWILGTHFEGEIAYFFEAGHKHQQEANALMNLIFKNPDLR
jgi:hypothetical protein